MTGLQPSLVEQLSRLRASYARLLDALPDDERRARGGSRPARPEDFAERRALPEFAEFLQARNALIAAAWAERIPHRLAQAWLAERGGRLRSGTLLDELVSEVVMVTMREAHKCKGEDLFSFMWKPVGRTLRRYAIDRRTVAQLPRQLTRRSEWYAFDAATLPEER
jgi:hypothetical protein